MKKRVLHIVASDKFTIGYIKYMLLNIKKCNHIFIVKKSEYIKNLDDEIKKYVILVNDNKEIFRDKKEFNSADKIIVSGVLGLEKYIFWLSDSILKKMYLHFWGGDFYSYRNLKIISKRRIDKMMLHSCIKRCAGIVNLIDNDYEEICKIFPNNNMHYTMIVPSDLKKNDIIEKNKNIKPIPGKILLGNSATKENHHIEALKKLERFKNDDIMILCPLSYGDKEYAKVVINVGRSIFKDKFIPITEYMEYDKYISLIASCSIVIFNNDRQQGLGNINVMLNYGRKVYLRATTSMWSDYTKYGITLYDINSIDNITFNDFINIDKIKMDINIPLMNKRKIDQYKTIDIFFDKILK